MDNDDLQHEASGNMLAQSYLVPFLRYARNSGIAKPFNERSIFPMAVKCTSCRPF